MKIRVGVFFGGKSVEHEVSVISALQACRSLNTDKYEIIPIYITKNTEFYIGENIGKIEEENIHRRSILKIPLILWIPLLVTRSNCI